MDVWEKAFSMKSELLNLIERLGERLPPNTLDQLIDELGGPDNVAEVCCSLRLQVTGGLVGITFKLKENNFLWGEGKHIKLH